MGGIQCFNCLANSVVWDNDFDAEELGYAEERNSTYIALQ